MAASYIKNRETISNYIKTFAALESVLETDAENTKKIDDASNTAAQGTSIS
jgi:predicted DNA binding CopG/RHH family protein